MENIETYGISIEFENKRRLFRELQQFEKKFNKINSDSHKAEMRRQKELLKLTEKNNDKKLRDEKKTNVAITRDAKKQADAEKRLKDKAQRDEQRRLAKDRAQQQKFHNWKLTQFRSAAFQRLSLEQKMELKRVLNSKKSEAEIREEYTKTTHLYRRELAQRNAYEKKQRAKERAKSGARGAESGGSSVGMPMVLGNAPMMAGAAVVAGGYAIKQGLTSGANKFERLRQGSDQTGLSVDNLQKRAFISQGLLGDEYGLDKQVDIWSDVREKIGQIKSEGEFNKNGEFTGGEGADLVNGLIKSGVIEANMNSVNAYFEQSTTDMNGFINKFTDDVNNSIADADKRRFIFESLASELGKLNNAFQNNAERVRTLSDEYNNSNIGLTDSDIQRLQKMDQLFSTIGARLNNWTLDFYSNFTKAFSPEQSKNLDLVFKGIQKLASGLGWLLGNGIQPLLAYLGYLTTGFKKLAQGFDYVTKKFDGFGNKLTSFFDDLLSQISSFFSNMLPSWMKSDDATKDKKQVDSKDNKPVYGYGGTYGYNNTLPSANPYGAMRPVPTVPSVPTLPRVTPPEPTAASNTQTQPVNNNNTTNVTVQPTPVTVTLDGNVIAQSVSKTDEFKNGVAQTVYPIFAGGQ